MTDLHDVARAFRESLPPKGDITQFRIDSFDRIGLPVVQANLFLPTEPATTGYGYGHREIEAEVGALGELCEEVHTAHAMTVLPRVAGSYADLAARHGKAVIDPLTLCLSAGSDYTDRTTLPWVWGRRYPSDEAVLVPREWVAAYPYQLHEPSRLITPITNGLGAGFDLPHAIAHGIMELLQRDGNVISYRALDQGVVVEIDTDEPPDVTDLLAHLRALGIAPLVKLAATDFGIANLYVVGDDTGTPAAPIQITACGEAAHPDRSRALRKALFEFVGSRARKAATHGPIPLLRALMPAEFVDHQIKVALVEEEENRALAAMADWLGDDTAGLRRRVAGSVLAEKRRVKFSALPHTPGLDDAQTRLDALASRLAAEGLGIVWVDCSPETGPVKVVKVIVPGLESETMSYHRIGWRGVRRLRERADPLIKDAPAEGAATVLLRPGDEERCGGPAWFDAALADCLVAELYPLYREPGPFSAQLMRGRRS